MADEDAPPTYEEATGNAPPPTVPTKRPVPSAPPPPVNSGYVPPQGDQGGNPWAYPRTSGYPHGSGGGYGQQQGYQLYGHNCGQPQGYNRRLQPGDQLPQLGCNSGPQPGYPPQQQCSYPNPTQQNQPSGPENTRGASNTNNAIRSNMCLVVCATVCCLPIGLIAIISECEARDAVKNGYLTQAKEASDKARSVSWISIFVGCCVIGFAVFFGLIVGLTSS